MAIKAVGVLGCGLMGAGIAQVSAAAGYQDDRPRSERGRAEEGTRAHRQVPDGRHRKGQGHRSTQKKTVLGNLTGTTKYADLKDCDLVIEAIIENVEIKQQAYAQVEAVVGRELHHRVEHVVALHHRAGAGTKRPDKVRRPALLQSGAADEAGRGDSRARRPASETYERSWRFAQAIGKEPITAPDRRASSSTACWCRICSTRSAAYEDGLGTVEDIDKGMKLGCGHPMGPFTLLDFVGLDTTYYIANIMFDEFREPRFAPPPLLKRMVLAGHLGKKSGKGFYDYSK